MSLAKVGLHQKIEQKADQARQKIDESTKWENFHEVGTSETWKDNPTLHPTQAKQAISQFEEDVLALVDEDRRERQEQLREFVDDLFAELEDQKHALTEQDLGSNIFQVDYEDAKKLIERVEKELFERGV